MSLSENFPHKLAILQVALRAKKLKINEYLQDMAEQSVISSLLVFLNSADFRCPITVPRKIIGQYSMLGRSALYQKLANLEERKLIERFDGEQAIRFTELGVSLLAAIDEKSESTTKKEKKSFFRVGQSSFPKEVIPLLTRGVSEKQMIFLMAEAKKAKVKIQEQINKFGKILDRYEGKTLFLVFRNFLRNPEKYKPVEKTKRVKQEFTTNQHRLLILLQELSCNDKGIIRPEEKVTNHEGTWTFSSPEINGGAPMPITDERLAELEQRLVDSSRKAIVEMDGHVTIQQAASPLPLVWDGKEQEGKPMVSAGNKHLLVPWGVIYSALPAEYQHWSFLFGEEAQDPRQGASFIRKGVRYLVERIASGRAQLFAVHNGRSWSENIEAKLLSDSSLQWV